MEVKYIKYDPKGNTVGISEGIISYWALNKEGYIVRSVEIKPNGGLLKYDEAHEADPYGQLPEGQTTSKDFNDKTYGSCIEITIGEFQGVWSKRAINRIET